MTDAAAAEKSQLLIHPNRWATVVFGDGRTVDLRPPSIAEFRIIRDAYGQAEEQSRASEDLLPRLPDGNVKIIDLDSVAVGDEASPGAVAFSVMIDTIGSAVIKPDDLPAWTSQTRVYLLLANVWRQVAIKNTGAPDTDKPVPIQPHFDQPAAEPEPAPAAPGDEVRWPDVNPTGALAPGPVRSPQRA